MDLDLSFLALGKAQFGAADFGGYGSLVSCLALQHGVELLWNPVQLLVLFLAFWYYLLERGWGLGQLRWGQNRRLYCLVARDVFEGLGAPYLVRTYRWLRSESRFVLERSCGLDANFRVVLTTFLGAKLPQVTKAFWALQGSLAISGLWLFAFDQILN